MDDGRRAGRDEEGGLGGRGNTTGREGRGGRGKRGGRHLAADADGAVEGGDNLDGQHFARLEADLEIGMTLGRPEKVTAGRSGTLEGLVAERGGVP